MTKRHACCPCARRRRVVEFGARPRSEHRRSALTSAPVGGGSSCQEKVAQPPRVAGELVARGPTLDLAPASRPWSVAASEALGSDAGGLAAFTGPTVESVTMSNRDDTPRGDGNSQPAACTCGEPKGAHYDDCALLAARREQRHRECDAHQCPWCPDATRGLYAAAYNAVLAWDMARAGTSDPERAHRKITELQHYVMDVYRPQVDAHFDALEREKPPSVRSRSTGTVVDTSDDES